MNYCCLFLIVLFSFFSFSQKVDKELYLKHTVKQEGESFQFTVLDGEKRGVWHYDKTKFYHWFKAQKVLSTQGGASGVLLNGNFEAFYDNKQLSQKGKFKKGLKDEEWLYWHSDGTLKKVENWKKGKKRGKEIWYDEQGKQTVSVDYALLKYTRKTSDSLIVSNYSGSKQRITTFDTNGKVIATNKVNAKEKAQKPASEEKKEFHPFSIFKKKEKGAESSKEAQASKKDKAVSTPEKPKENRFGFLKKKTKEDKTPKEPKKK